MFEIKLFGIPEIKYNNKKIVFPFKKAEGIFYYLLINKTVTRDELINLFWGDISEDIARKNLRNAIYRIKKELNSSIILSPQKNTLCIDEQIKINSDYNQLFFSNNNILEISDEEFLKGFYIKKSMYFEDWLYEIRENCKRERICKLKAYALKIPNIEEKIEIYERILKLDKLDEVAYSNLIKVYSDDGKYHQAIKCFHNLTDVLNEELGVEPDETIVKFVQKIILNRKKFLNEEKKENTIIGRKREKNVILNQINMFLSHNEYKNILISGEAGIGKTSLFNSILNELTSMEVLCLKSECYKVDKDFYLKAWSNVVEGISKYTLKNNVFIEASLINPLRRIFPSFSLQNRKNDKEENVFVPKKEEFNARIFNNTIEEVLKNILIKITSEKKIIIFFEDIQWMDNQSLSLLIRLVHDLKDKVMLVLTLRNDNSDLHKIKNLFYDENILKSVELKGFSMEETMLFIDKFKKVKSIEKKVKEKIYLESEGNPLFISEYLKMANEKSNFKLINEKIASVLEGRFSELSKNARQIINIMSVFSRDVRFDRLIEISNKSELELLEITQELRNNYLIKDIGTDIVSFIFTHSKLKEYIYDTLNFSFKKIIHRKIGDIIEKDYLNSNLRNDIDTLSDLIFHYKCSNEKLKMLKYKLDYVAYYLDYVHELYPKIKKEKSVVKKLRILDRESVKTEFKEIDGLFKEIEKIYSDELINLENAKYLYIKGRYFIRNGEYEEGKKYIKRQILISNSLEQNENAIKGYKQLIFMTIQRHDINMMRIYLESAMKLEKKCSIKYEKGVLTRLLGLYYLMNGNFKESLISFEKAIKIFREDILNISKYVLNIAACYNYIGEINRREGQYIGADTNYQMAINICVDSNVRRGLEIFYTNLGQVSMETNNIENAYKYFVNATEYFDENGTLWHKSIAVAFLSYIELVKNKNVEASFENLKIAINLSVQLGNPYDIGLVKYIEFIVMERDELICNKCIKELDANLNELEKEAIRYFNEANASFEIERLDRLRVIN
ncbi:AAA family ATPase [Helicovermis profundi]|uniref:AAA family ATPase n=1 Tax=Helicovermis profundi TaxID=3065157 RepID=A0AAU9E445_9FIRM|nr:AAA family ATPase [Clostridia bacterium S502]